MKKVVVNKFDLTNNILILKRLLKEKAMGNSNKDPKVIAVAKGNGMGLGLNQYVDFLNQNENIDYIAVSTYEEVESLIDNELNTKNNIMLLSVINNEEELGFLINNDIILTTDSLENLEVINNLAKVIGKRVRVQVKIDVGLGRYGFLYNDLNGIIGLYRTFKDSNIDFFGIFSHIVNSENEKEAKKEFERFNSVLSFLKDNNIDVGLKHISASRPFILYSEMILDAVRLRINTYRKNTF